MILVIAIILVPLCLNIFATLLIRRDQYSEKTQKLAQ